jgi:hypothetical protein
MHDTLENVKRLPNERELSQCGGNPQEKGRLLLVHL